MATISHKLLSKHGVDVDPDVVVKGVKFFEKTEEGVGRELCYAKDGKKFEKMASSHPNTHRVPIIQ